MATTKAARKTTAKRASTTKKNYALKDGGPAKRVAAPDLPYTPRDPKRYRPNIGLIGCGGITRTHLTAYRKAGYHVVALCDVVEAAARERQQQFYPRADVYTDHRELLARDDIEVVDIAPHPEQRAPLIEDALKAGKHVLSQKPFVVDLDLGRRLVRLAKRKGVKLAVNQNGRWAPHFSYMRHAIRHGLIGDVMSAHMSVHWDHSWIKGTPFEKIRHVILCDFAIHWFDILHCFTRGMRPRSVFATVTRSPAQEIRPGLLAQVMVQFDRAQASLAFDADTRFGWQDRTYIAGTKGTLTSVGPSLGDQTVTLHTAQGVATPKLKGSWFPDGFHGTMAELLCAVEEHREPTNSAEDNLASLALCFAAIESAERGEPVRPREVKRLWTPDGALRRRARRK